MSTLRDEIEAINERLGQLQADLDTERQEGENFTEPDDAEAPAGN